MFYKPRRFRVQIPGRTSADPSVLKGVGVESKFGEPYSQDQGDFVDCYVAPENASIWEGCERLQELAVRINNGEKKIYQRLKVSQLIKHILGLKNQFEGMQNFDLVYLWYPAPGSEAVEHEEEIRRFQKLTDDCQLKVKFRAVTYQDLIDSLARSHGVKHGAYLDYLMQRYF